MGTISVDQMVTDFNSYLDSNMWDQIRERSGYDALFIDELPSIQCHRTADSS